MDVLEAGDRVCDGDWVGEPLREVGDSVVHQREVSGTNSISAVTGIGRRRLAELGVEDRDVAEEGEPFEESAGRTLGIADEKVVVQRPVSGSRAVSEGAQS